jgi:hypothetical protein
MMFTVAFAPPSASALAAALAGTLALAALAWTVRALQARVDALETTLLARDQRLEMLCAQLKTALETGRVTGEFLSQLQDGGSARAVTLASVGGLDINLGATLQPDAHAASRWLVNAAHWLWRA